MSNPYDHPNLQNTLSREQADRIIEVIQQDATGKLEMFQLDDAGEPLYCVLGGLGKAMGIADWALKMNDDCLGRIQAEYGLRRNHMYPLYATNDDHRVVARRRTALISLVKGWVKHV